MCDELMREAEEGCHSSRQPSLFTLLKQIKTTNRAFMDTFRVKLIQGLSSNSRGSNISCKIYIQKCGYVIHVANIINHQMLHPKEN